jgi:hypothetical protein
VKVFAVCVLAAAAIVALVFVSGADNATQARFIEVIAVTARAEVPAPPLGREGDGERLLWSIRDRFGRSIGVGIIGCRWQKDQARLCTGELRFPLGKISVSGVSQTRSLGEWAVIGGTGRYIGAGGQLTFRATGLRRLTVIIII